MERTKSGTEVTSSNQESQDNWVDASALTELQGRFKVGGAPILLSAGLNHPSDPEVVEQYCAELTGEVEVSEAGQQLEDLIDGVFNDTSDEILKSLQDQIGEAA